MTKNLFSDEKLLAILSKLIEFQVENLPHSRRSLLDHLIGVFNLLKTWKNPDYVCIAGLYHSIYGTKEYRIKTVDFSNRKIIKDIIGEQSEEIVYIYCTCDHKSLFPTLKIKDNFSIKSLSKMDVYLSNQLFCNVVEVAVANLLEQISYLNLDSSDLNLLDIYSYWEMSLPYISNSARTNLYNFLRD